MLDQGPKSGAGQAVKNLKTGEEYYMEALGMIESGVASLWRQAAEAIADHEGIKGRLRRGLAI